MEPQVENPEVKEKTNTDNIYEGKLLIQDR